MTAIAKKIDRIIANLNDIKRIHEVEIAGEAELVEFFHQNADIRQRWNIFQTSIKQA